MRNAGLLVLAVLAGCARFPASEIEFHNAFDAAYRARVEGPAIVPVAGKTTLRVQSGQAWVPTAPAERLLRAIGAESRPDLLGLLVNAVQERPVMAIVYATDRREPALPGIGVAGWRDAPDLEGFRPR